MKALLILSLMLAIGFVWLLYLYLDRMETHAVQENVRMEQAVAPTHLEEPVQDGALQETVRAFCQALYTDKGALSSYATERALSLIVPPADNSEAARIEMKVDIHDISVYEGTMTDKHAVVVAGIARTTTIRGIATTSTSYLKLDIVKEDRWRVNDSMLLADMPDR